MLWFQAVTVGNQWFLLQSDHGRELYCIDRVGQGASPYDQFWIYGPLMPYLFALFRPFLGISILAVRIEMAACVGLATVFTWLAVRRGYGPTAAHFAAVVTLLCGAPPHSYNHVGLLVAVAAGSWALASAAEPGALTWRRVAAVFLPGLAAGLVKWTAGVTWTGATALLLCLRELASGPAPAAASPGVRRTLAGAGATLLLLAAAYLAICASLPVASRGQYLSAMTARWGGARDLLQELLAWPLVAWSAARGGDDTARLLLEARFLLPFLYLVTVGLGGAVAFRRALRAPALDTAFYRLLFAWVLAAVMGHEFISRGSTYSLGYLALVPMLVVLVALLRAGLDRLPARWARRVGVAGTLAWAVGATLWVGAEGREALRMTGPRLALPRAGGVRMHSLRQREELEAVAACVGRLTAPGEPVGVLPYNHLISFLADRPNPIYAVAQAGFDFDEVAEEEMIRQLEEPPVRCVVLANSAVSPDPLDGFLGLDYLPRLAAHLSSRFVPVAWFGFDPWSVPAGREEQQAIVFWRTGIPRPPDLPR